RAAADGVDHDVNSPEPLHDLGDQPLRVLLAGHVGGARKALRPAGLRPLDRGLEGLAAPAGDRDAGPRGGKGVGDGGSQPAASSVHYRDLTAQAEAVEALRHRGVPAAGRMSGSGRTTSRTAAARSWYDPMKLRSVRTVAPKVSTSTGDSPSGA